MAKKKPAEPVKRGRGRPATGRKRAVRFVIRMTEEELSAIQTAAARENMAPTVWGLGAMLAVARMTRQA